LRHAEHRPVIRFHGLERGVPSEHEVSLPELDADCRFPSPARLCLHHDPEFLCVVGEVTGHDAAADPWSSASRK